MTAGCTAVNSPITSTNGVCWIRGSHTMSSPCSAVKVLVKVRPHGHPSSDGVYMVLTEVDSKTQGTLLNRLFGTSFDVMDESRRQQTTKGRSVGNACWPPVC
jgi:hypothetical protein